VKAVKAMAVFGSVFVVLLLGIASLVGAGKGDGSPVTCGSVVKLVHKETVRIHCSLFITKCRLWLG
jgi:hypothetical protein